MRALASQPTDHASVDLPTRVTGSGVAFRLVFCGGGGGQGGRRRRHFGKKGGLPRRAVSAVIHLTGKAGRSENLQLPQTHLLPRCPKVSLVEAEKLLRGQVFSTRMHCLVARVRCFLKCVSAAPLLCHMLPPVIRLRFAGMCSNIPHTNQFCNACLLLQPPSPQHLHVNCHENRTWVHGEKPTAFRVTGDGPRQSLEADELRPRGQPCCCCVECCGPESGDGGTLRGRGEGMGRHVLERKGPTRGRVGFYSRRIGCYRL